MNEKGSKKAAKVAAEIEKIKSGKSAKPTPKKQPKSKGSLAEKIGAKVADKAKSRVAGRLVTKALSGPVFSRVAGVASIGSGVKSMKDGDIINGILDTAAGLGLILFNHPEWYNNYDLNGLVNLNYGRKKGVKEDILRTICYDSDGMEITVPSAVGLTTVLTKPKTLTNDWDQGIQYLYSTIRAANSGYVNYTMFDLERYVWDVRNIHAIYAQLQRAYGLLSNISLYDANTPRIYFTTAGLDYDDYAANAANIKQYANKLSLQIAKLLPLNLPLIQRTRWMFSNLFADSDDLKASVYLFRLPFVTDVSGDTATDIKIASDTIQPMKWTEAEPNISSYVARVTSNDTYAVIAGDILKAFGEEAIFPSSVWPEVMPVPQVYDEYALTQIQNASVSTVSSTSITLSKTAFMKQEINIDAGFSFISGTGIGNDNQFQDMNRFINAGTFVNAPMNDITPEETLSFTRLAHVVNDIPGAGRDKSTTTIKYCGTEMISVLTYVIIDGQGNIEAQSMPAIQNLFRLGTVVSGNQRLQASFITVWGSMDWMPRCAMVVTINEGGTSRVLGTLYDFNNYAVLSQADNAMFHGYAAMSLLAVPRLLKQSNAEVITD